MTGLWNHRYWIGYPLVCICSRLVYCIRPAHVRLLLPAQKPTQLIVLCRDSDQKMFSLGFWLMWMFPRRRRLVKPQTCLSIPGTYVSWTRLCLTSGTLLSNIGLAPFSSNESTNGPTLAFSPNDWGVAYQNLAYSDLRAPFSPWGPIKA